MTAGPASRDTGPDGTGLDGTGLDGTGLDGTGLDGTGLDRTGPAGTGPDGAETRRFADDLAVGTRGELGRWTLTEEDIVAFARTFDPQPLHIDPAVAARGHFGGVIASGTHTLAIHQALLVEAFYNRVVGKAGRTVAAQYKRPVRAGTVTGWFTIAGIRPRPGRGDALVRLEVVLVDGEGAVLCEIDAESVLLMRPATAERPASAEPAEGGGAG